MRGMSWGAKGALLAVLLVLVLVPGAPAWAYTDADEWHGGATEVGFRWEEVTGSGPYVGEGEGSVPELIGDSSATVGLETVRRWYDVWSPTGYTRAGLAVGCAGTGDTSSTFIAWLDARTGLGWSTVVEDGPGTAGVVTVDCTNWGDIVWLGLIVRSWPVLIDEKQEFRVVLEAGTRPACDLPPLGQLSRECYDSEGGEGGIWLVGSGTEVVGGVSVPYLDVGIDQSGCDFSDPVFSGGGTTASGTVGRTYPWQAGSSPVRAYGTMVLTLDNTPGFTSQNVYSDATTVAGTASGWAMPSTGSGSVTQARPSVLGWTPSLNNGTFRLHLASLSGTVSGSAMYRSAFSFSNNSTMSNENAARAASGSGWSVSAGGLSTPHSLVMYCVKDSLAVDAGISSADADATCREMWVKPGSPERPTFFAACWEVMGDLQYNPGDSGSVTQPDPEGSAEEEGCSISLAGIDCAITEIGDAVDEFLESLTDLPETLFRLAVSIFVPTSYTAELLSEFRASLESRPPVSIMLFAVDVGGDLVDVIGAGGCDAPDVDLGSMGAYELPSRCDETLTGYDAVYSVVRAGLYISLVWALWQLGRDAFRS